MEVDVVVVVGREKHGVVAGEVNACGVDGAAAAAAALQQQSGTRHIFEGECGGVKSCSSLSSLSPPHVLFVVANALLVRDSSSSTSTTPLLLLPLRLPHDSSDESGDDVGDSGAGNDDGCCCSCCS